MALTGVAGGAFEEARSCAAMMGMILAAVSAMTLESQQGNQSLSPSCTASQPSMLSGWLTVVYLARNG